MISGFFTKLFRAILDKDVRNKILFMLGALLAFRALSAIPVPSIDSSQLAALFAQNQFLGLLNIFAGGGLGNLSIVMLGVVPYITASILMQLGTVLSTRLKQLYSEEGEAGRATFMQWSRVLSLPLAVIQGVGFLMLLRSQGVLGAVSMTDFLFATVVIVAGAVLTMWIGELITEYGVGNGISFIVFAGIVSSLPSLLAQTAFTFSLAQLPNWLAFAALGLAITIGVVLVTGAERTIPIAHPAQMRAGASRIANQTFLPIKLNYAGVMPIIFAVSLIVFPQMAATFAAAVWPSLAGAAAAVQAFLANQWIYAALYFVLIILFTYFYTAITFEPKKMAESLQKGGSFIPGVRPGKETEDFLARVVERTTLPGAIFLGLIAVVPLAVQGLTQVNLVIGGTSLLILVSVVLDIVRKVDAQISAKDY